LEFLVIQCQRQS